MLCVQLLHSNICSSKNSAKYSVTIERFNLHLDWAQAMGIKLEFQIDIKI